MQIKLNNKYLYYLLFFAAFIRPEYLDMMPSVGIFYNYYRILIVILTSLIFACKKVKPSRYTLMWGLFAFWVLFVTIFRNGNIMFAFSQALTIITIAFFWQINSKDIYGICKALYYFLGFLIVINFISLFAFPDGMYVTGFTNTASENWFLGFKNKHMVYFLPFIGLNFIFWKLEGGNIKKLLMMGIVALSALYEQSSTTIVCMATMLFIAFFPGVRKNYKIFNMYTYFGISILMFIMIPLLRLQYLFSYLIVDILNKSIDLTYRTDLWDYAFVAIQQHVFIGWGEQVNDVKYTLYNSQSIISAHNQILEYLYTGGIALSIIYIVINLMLATKLHRINKSEIIQIASGMYFALQIALIVEVYTDSIIYILYFLLWYLQDLTKVDFIRSRLR